MAKLLDFVVRCNTANEDDITMDVLRMADPTGFKSRDEMRECFELCLGYNPEKYFDHKYIEEQLADICAVAPNSVKDQLWSKRCDILDRVINLSDDITENMLKKLLITVIEDTIGWRYREDDPVSLDDCITMSVFGPDAELGDEDDSDDDSYSDEELNSESDDSDSDDY